MVCRNRRSSASAINVRHFPNISFAGFYSVRARLEPGGPSPAIQSHLQSICYAKEVIRLDEGPVLKTGSDEKFACGFESHGFRLVSWASFKMAANSESRGLKVRRQLDMLVTVVRFHSGLCAAR